MSPNLQKGENPPSRTMARRRKAIGVVEPVTVRGQRGQRTVSAKVDTCASRTVVDMSLAATVGLGPLVRTSSVRSGTSRQGQLRPVASAHIVIAGKRFDARVGVSDRSRSEE